MFVIQTRNYILKCVNHLQYFLPKWHVIKNKHTCRHTCRFGESGIGRNSGGWKFPEPSSLRSVSSGNFQPPSVRPIPRTHLPASMFVIEHRGRICIRSDLKYIYIYIYNFRSKFSLTKTLQKSAIFVKTLKTTKYFIILLQCIYNNR
jgi:hypothetical protein